MSYTLRTFGDPALSTVCEPLTPEDDLSFLNAMRRVCDEENGVGLAAPQIGVLKRAAFIWPQRKGGEALFMLNPRIVHEDGGLRSENEGCLSYPGVFVPVERWSIAIVKFMDTDWVEHTRTFTFYPARVVQHEIDHLSGACKVGDAWRKQKVPTPAERRGRR